MSGRRRTVLVLQDGSETIRQPHADNEQFFGEVLRGAYLSQRDMSLKVAVDDDCLHELSGVTPGEYACLVFSSNALIRPDGPVKRAVQNSSEDLRQYLADGGAIVVLHQSYPEDSWELDVFEFLGPLRLVARERSAERCSPSWVDDAHPLSQFPNVVSTSDLRESRVPRSDWRLGFPLYYNSMTLREDVNLLPVLSDAANPERVLIAEMQTGGRLVFTTLPVDWARQTPLMENLIAYAIDGLPEVVVLDGGSAEEATARLAIARLSGQTSVFDLSSWRVEPTDLSKEQSYLVSMARAALIIGDQDSTPLYDTHGFDRLLESGGLLIRWSPDLGGKREELNVTVENQIPRELALALAQDLRMLDLAEWSRHALIHDVRDAWLGLEAIEGIPGSRSQELAPIMGTTERCQGWVSNNRASNDAGTALIVAWLLYTVGRKEECRRLIDQLPSADELVAEQQLLLAGVRSALGGEAVDWVGFADQVAATELTAAAAVRFLDAIRASYVMAPGSIPPDAAERLSNVLATAIGDDGWTLTTGWVSIDRTAAVVAGLSLLASAKLVPVQVVAVLANGAAPLNRWLRNQENSAGDHTLTRIRVREALLRLESAVPSASQAALSRLLASGLDDRGIGGTRAQANQLAESLTDARAKLSVSLEQVRNLTSNEQSHRTFALSDLTLASRVYLLAWSGLVFSALAASLYLAYRTLTAFLDGAPSGDQFGAVGAVAAGLAVTGIIWSAGRQVELHRRMPSDHVRVERKDQ